MTAVSASALIVRQTAEGLLALALELAAAVGLPVSSWRTGDPTRAQFKYQAETLELLDQMQSEHVQAGWLSTAVALANETGDSSWLKVLAWEVYGVEAEEADYSTPTVTVTNSGGGHYEIEANDLTFRSSSTDKTFHNTNAVTLSAGVTATFDLEADEAGSDSSVGVDEVDELVTTLLGVVVDSSTAGVGQDEQTPEEIEEQCLATTGALSPNGPRDAYEFVARSSTLTGVSDVTRAKTIDDSDTGDVTLVIAGASGPVAGASVTAVTSAIATWATPWTITATVQNASATTQNFSMTVSGDDIPAGFEDEIETALGALLATVDIGGTLALSEVIAVVRNKLIALGASNVIVVLATPAATITYASTAVPVLGTVSATEV